MATAGNTWFASKFDTTLIFHDFPSVADGKVIFGKTNPRTGAVQFHHVSINPETNCFGEMRFAAPTAQMAGTVKIEDDRIVFNGLAYFRQGGSYPHPIVMFDRSSIDRSAYDTYECKQFVQGVNDKVYVYVIAPPDGFYDDYVVFVGYGSTLCEVTQYRPYDRRRYGDNIYVTLDSGTLKALGLNIPAQNYTINTDNGTWVPLKATDYDIRITGATGYITKR